MREKLSKEKLASIETAFRVLRENDTRDPGVSLNVIKESLESCFPESQFSVTLVDKYNDDKMFVMSVFPGVSTAEKIIDAVLANKDTKAIQKLWEANKTWRIEIDARIFNKNIISFTDKELTALLLHEVGHIVISNSIPTRISLILRYEITKSSFNVKSMLKTEPFKRIMSLPIFDSCVADNKKNKSSIKEELKADKYAKKYGYSKDLFSAIDKLSKCKMYPTNPSINDKMKKVTAFSVQTLDDFRVRKDNLVRHNLFTLAESVESTFMEEYVNGIISSIYEDGENMYTGQKADFLHERVKDTIKGDIMQEFFVFNGKTRKKVSNDELVYIATKINEIQTETDRMMIVTYINSKLDLVNYYITLLESPDAKNKYNNIPHTLEDLYTMKKKLNNYQIEAMKRKLPMANQVSYVAWPSGPARALYVPDVRYPEGYEG